MTKKCYNNYNETCKLIKKNTSSENKDMYEYFLLLLYVAKYVSLRRFAIVLNFTCIRCVCTCACACMC